MEHEFLRTDGFKYVYVFKCASPVFVIVIVLLYNFRVYLPFLLQVFSKADRGFFSLLVNVNVYRGKYIGVGPP